MKNQKYDHSNKSYFTAMLLVPSSWKFCREHPVQLQFNFVYNKSCLHFLTNLPLHSNFAQVFVVNYSVVVRSRSYDLSARHFLFDSVEDYNQNSWISTSYWVCSLLFHLLLLSNRSYLYSHLFEAQSIKPKSFLLISTRIVIANWRNS